MANGAEDELKRLRESERHYRTLLDESSDPTFSFLPDGTYRYVNRAFAEGTGRALEEIIGHRIWDVFSKEEADRRFAAVQRVFREGTPLELEVRVPLPSGDTYYLTTVKPIRGADGTVETVICTSKNITQRKVAELALEAEKARLIAALAEIRTLTGLLPICASCKSIRDEVGQWGPLEAYLEQRTEAAFTHTVCPDCAARLYPEVRLPGE